MWNRGLCSIHNTFSLTHLLPHSFTAPAWVFPLACSVGICIVFICAAGEWFELEGTFKDHVVPTPWCWQGHLSLDQVAKSFSNLILNGSWDGASTTSPGSLFQWFTPFLRFSLGPISQSCHVPSEWHLFLEIYQLRHSTWRHPQTC